MPARDLRFQAELRTQRCGWLGVELPSTSAEVLGTRAQVPVVARIGRVTFRTVAYPTWPGRHFMPVKEAVRRRAALMPGMPVNVALRRAEPRARVATPAELEAAVTRTPRTRSAWEELTPAMRQAAARWVGGAVSPEVRRYRSADVVRRALRRHSGAGPFYPTAADQPLLSRGRPADGRRAHGSAVHRSR